MLSAFLTIIQTLVLAVQSWLAVLTSYLLVLTAASRKASPKTAIPDSEPDCKFLILIPAHNEERLLGATLDSLAQLDYPQGLFSIHVVADNCSDRTAAIATEKGALVHQRFNQELIGKGYALQWLLERLWKDEIAHDAVVFLDADSIVSTNFLRVMAARLSRGEKAIQAYYAVREPDKSWNSALRYAALAVIHYLRPQGRMVLGGSAGLKGNGMVFSADLMRRFTWSASLTEDIELHMALVQAGERVTFAPDAVVWGEMPHSLANMQTQHMRWERGRMDMARTYVSPLLKLAARDMKAGNRQQAFVFFDSVMEHIIPPFSLLTGLVGLSLGVNFAVNGIGSAVSKRADHKQEYKKIGRVNLILSAALLTGQIFYLFSGLRLVKAPRSIYKKLFYAPVLIVWKLKQYLVALLTRTQPGWTRTTRNGG